MTALRLAFLVHDIDACGGMERQALLLASRLAARGHRLQILCTDVHERSWRGLVSSPERRGDLEVRRIPILRGIPLETARELALLGAAGALLRGGGVDAIYAVQVSACPLAHGLGRLLGSPWVVKLAGGGFSGDVQAILAGEDGDRHLRAFQHAGRVVCLSSQIEEEVMAAAAIPRERLVRLTNGVDVAAIACAQALPLQEVGLQPSARPILFVGRLDAGKRVDVLLRALALLRPTRPDACLLIAGRGPDEAQLESLAAELGLGGQVRFLGQRTDVPRLLKLAGAFVLPSAAEGMSNALLEALAAGTPVVASRIPANEGVVDDRSAWLVPVDDAPALACALEQALADDPAARARAAHGALLAAERFDIEQVAAAHERLFRELLEEAAARSWLRALPALEEQTRHTRGWLRAQGEARLRRSISAAIVRAKRLARVELRP